MNLYHWAAAVCLLVLAGCGPSCEDQGGRREFSHHRFIYQPAFKQNVLVPQYRCRLPAGEKP